MCIFSIFSPINALSSINFGLIGTERYMSFGSTFIKFPITMLTMYQIIILIILILLLIASLITTSTFIGPHSSSKSFTFLFPFIGFRFIIFTSLCSCHGIVFGFFVVSIFAFELLLFFAFSVFGRVEFLSFFAAFSGRILHGFLRLFA